MEEELEMVGALILVAELARLEEERDMAVELRLAAEFACELAELARLEEELDIVAWLVLVAEPGLATEIVGELAGLDG